MAKSLATEVVENRRKWVASVVAAILGDPEIFLPLTQSPWLNPKAAPKSYAALLVKTTIQGLTEPGNGDGGYTRSLQDMHVLTGHTPSALGRIVRAAWLIPAFACTNGGDARLQDFHTTLDTHAYHLGAPVMRDHLSLGKLALNADLDRIKTLPPGAKEQFWRLMEDPAFRSENFGSITNIGIWEGMEHCLPPRMYTLFRPEASKS